MVVTVIPQLLYHTVTTYIGTYQTVIVAVCISASIGSYIAILIQVSTCFRIMTMDRHVRSDGTSKHLQVRITRRVIRVCIRIARAGTSETQVQTCLQPLGRRYVVIDTTGVTFKVGLNHVTIILQVTYRCISIALIGLGVITQDILLTVTGLEHGIFPVQVLTPLVT